MKKYDFSNLAKVVGLEFIDYYGNPCKIVNEEGVEIICESMATGGRFTTLKHRFFKHVNNGNYKLIGAMKDSMELPKPINNKLLACIL